MYLKNESALMPMQPKKKKRYGSLSMKPWLHAACRGLKEGIGSMPITKKKK